MDLETKYKKMKLSFDLMEKTAIKAMDVLADYHFNPEEVDEKTLHLIQKHNEIAQHYLNKINVPDEKKKPFIELANYLLRRES